MCHIILLLPLLSLPVFWMWPISLATPVYGVILVLSIWTYFFVMRAMKRPVETGTEGILRETGRVIEAMQRRARVRVHSEIWDAVSPDKLHKGDRVQVDAVEGLTLRARKVGHNS
jgi:membrane-bound serine protease (ClpP class)